MKELIAVNFILTQMGEAPATSLEERSPTISLARTYMGMAKSNMLAIKWWFNNPTVKLAPDTAGRINAPANAIAIYSKEQFNVEVHGKYLHNVTEDTQYFTAPITVELVLDVPFENLPELAAEYVMNAALIKLYQADYGVDNNLNVISGSANNAMQNLKREHLRKKRYNSSNGLRHATRVLTGQLMQRRY